LAGLAVYAGGHDVNKKTRLGKGHARKKKSCVTFTSGCVVWMRWAPHRCSGWYVGPGLSLWCFRLLF
jgi:hypothetical protein